MGDRVCHQNQQFNQGSMLNSPLASHHLSVDRDYCYQERRWCKLSGARVGRSRRWEGCTPGCGGSEATEMDDQCRWCSCAYGRCQNHHSDEKSSKQLAFPATLQVDSCVRSLTFASYLALSRAIEIKKNRSSCQNTLAIRVTFQSPDQSRSNPSEELSAAQDLVRVQ